MKNSLAPCISLALALSAIVPAQAVEPPVGRLLASQCFQCHGTNGQSRSGIDSISGKSAGSLYSELMEMKAKPPGANVMVQQAKAYTDAELQAIANYLATLPAGSGDD